MDPMIQALCHPSYANEKGCESYETLEFLGDAILGLIISERLTQLFPNENEGFLTKAKSAIVSNEALAVAAKKAGLDKRIKKGTSFDLNGNDKILADCFEATVAATYKKQGYQAARTFVLENTDINRRHDKDYKSELQELAQSRKLVPVYEVISREGLQHETVFTVKVSVGSHCENGQGSSIKNASKDAAMKLFRSIP